MTLGPFPFTQPLKLFQFRNQSPVFAILLACKETSFSMTKVSEDSHSRVRFLRDSETSSGNYIEKDLLIQGV